MPAPSPRRWASALLIGCLLTTPQIASGQSPSGQDPWIRAGDRRYEGRFRALLVEESTRDLRAGWLLAQRLGRPVVPMLWGLLDAERSNVERRLAVLGAALIAGGPAEDERLFAFLDQDRAMLPERVMASLWIALGPQRTRSVRGALPRILGPNKEPEELLAVAARLAAARAEPDAPRSAPLESDDPGLLAAAAFCGMPVARTSSQRQWRSRHRDASLFRRAAFLADRRAVKHPDREPMLLERAKRALQERSAGGSKERDAAVLLLAAASALDAQQPGLDWRQLRIVASEPASATFLRSRLQPTPLARDPQPERLAAAFALWMPVDQVVSSRDTWGQDRRICSSVAVALAARLCATPEEVSLDFDLPGVPEWAFAKWAAGGRFEVQGDLRDPRLANLAVVLANGRASKGAVQEELELALWRWRSHPGLAAWELERELVRDLLLVGSRSGGKYAPGIAPHLRYFPAGLDRDDSFFDVAVALFEFTGASSGPVPAEHRLR